MAAGDAKLFYIARARGAKAVQVAVQGKSTRGWGDVKLSQGGAKDALQGDFPKTNNMSGKGGHIKSSPKKAPKRTKRTGNWLEDHDNGDER